MIKEYLKENLLELFLQDRIAEDFIRNKTIPNTGTRFRPDFRSESLKLIIEFDGYLHYNNARTQYNDNIKYKLYEDLNYKLIRIPYFIQLDSKVIEKLFSDYTTNYKTFNSYKHGFISENCLLPIDYNQKGLIKFSEDLEYFNGVINDIKRSLVNKIIKLGSKDLVIPQSFEYLCDLK